MKYSWRKDNKYYNLRLQTNLLGSVDVVCSLGSVHNKQGAGYKVISCYTQKDIDLVIQNITKRIKTRGYELYF